MMTATLEEGTPRGLLEKHIEPFIEHLRVAGYAERTRRKKRTVANAFALWTKQKQIAVEDLNESHVAAFVARSPRRRKAHVKFELSAIRLLYQYLRVEAGLVRPPPQDEVSSAAAIVQRYEDHLRNDRGLAENSVRVYVPFIRDFLAGLAAATSCLSTEVLNPPIIRQHLLDRSIGRSSEHTRLLATSLRSFLRFLFLCGDTPQDLSASVPTVRRHGQVAMPPFLPPEEVERVLAATDRESPVGRRDHAILLLLARLGLRAGEIVSLDLGDIRWRSGEVVVCGKGRMVDHLPLLADVGQALALYLRQDRGESASRRVFIRMWAPRVGLAGPAAVGHIVRRALARAGIDHPGRSAAHLFRHGLATKMIRHGASMAEISEVLRHRSQTTTAIYAQVSFEALRAVALPWPATGGGR